MYIRFRNNLKKIRQITQKKLQTFSGQTAGPSNHSSENSNTEKIRWYYIDLEGAEQGPFNCGEMLEWYEARYFPETHMVRRVDMDNG